MPRELVAKARKRMSLVIEESLQLYRRGREEALDVLADYLAGRISREGALRRLRALAEA